MEASHCGQDLSSHTASLLTGLNLQREQAQFCDCVVRQRQSPGQLYPAHRCVLAASSPVLASILSSTGALVELRAPCLSGSVLALLLDYIYTGTLPYTRTQQCYYSLLTAAHYLQMDELQEALRVWQQTEVTDADKTNASTATENEPCKDIVDTHCKTANSCSTYLPLMCGTDVFRRREENDTCSVRSAASSEREDRRYSVSAETCDEAQMPSTSINSCLKAGETDPCGASGIHGANCCSRKDVSTLSNVSVGCCISENCRERSENTVNCRQVTYLTPQDLIQDIPCTAELHEVSKVDKAVQKDQFHSPGTVKPETWQKRTEEELVRTAEDRRNSASSSSPHPCCGAVPVIRHSSRAAMFQLAEESTMPLYHPVSQASVNSSRAPASLSASTDSGSIAEGITTKHKNHSWVQNQDYRNNKDHTGEQSWDYQNSTDQCAIQDLCYKSSTDQSDMLEQDYNSSNEGNFMKQNDEHMDNGLSHVTGHNGHHAHCDSFQNENHRQHDSVPQNRVCRNFIRRLKYKTNLSYDDDDLPSKHQRLDWSDCHIVSKSAAAEELSQHPRAAVSLSPVEGSDTRSDWHCEDLSPDGDRKADWYPKLHKTETSTQDTASSQHGHDLDNRDTAMEGKRPSADVCLPNSTTSESSLDHVTGGVFAFERRTSLELDKVPYSEIPQPHLTYTIPLDNNISDPTHGVVGQSYHGHLHYHCLPQEDTHLLHRDSNHKHSHPSHPDYLDQSSDEEEDGTFASPGHSSLRQHFVAGSTDQVLLLDISTKPAELLVSYKHRSEGEDDEEEEKAIAFCKNDTFGTGVNNEATSAAEVDKRKIRARIKFGPESFDVDESESSAGDKNVEERKSVDKDQIMPGADLIHEAGIVEEVSNPKEGDNRSSTLTDCSRSSVQGLVQASMSSTLSACIPSTLSASMPTDISAHLSTPLHHPFQCSLCDRSFSQRGSLNRHVRSHFGVRPFPCPCCPMTFSRQYRVTEHMRVHQRCTLGNDFHKPPAS